MIQFILFVCFQIEEKQLSYLSMLKVSFGIQQIFLIIGMIDLIIWSSLLRHLEHLYYFVTVIMFLGWYLFNAHILYLYKN